MKYDFETSGSASNLVITFEKGDNLINYQLQMLVNNEIKNILQARKRQKNEDIQVFYNITSRISLAQITQSKKITKEGLYNIIRGGLDALTDIEGYQLAGSGVLFDEEYIFVKPGSFEPAFVYLPNSVENVGIESLKKFILNLIMSSKVEVTNDNFIQVLLAKLNEPGLDAKSLRKLCDGQKEEQPKAKAIEEKLYAPTPTHAETPPVMQSGSVLPAHQGVPPIGKTGISGINQKPKNNSSKKTKEPKEKNQKKLIFELLQLVFLAVIVGVYLSGFITDAEGNLNFRYFGVVILVLAVVDFIVYREMFVNNKNKEEKKENKQKKDSGTRPKKAVPMAGKMPSAPAMPKKVPPFQPQPAPAPQTAPKPQVNIPPQLEPEEASAPASPLAAQLQHIQNSVERSKRQTPSARQTSMRAEKNMPIDFGDEATDVLEDEEGAYLEYYENGLSMKISINKPSVIVGKLQSQCDYAINNKKVSRMHAIFSMRDGLYYVQDCNSKNGTYINESSQRIQSNVEYPISNGDHITLANVQLTFHCQ